MDSLFVGGAIILLLQLEQVCGQVIPQGGQVSVAARLGQKYDLNYFKIKSVKLWTKDRDNNLVAYIKGTVNKIPLREVKCISQEQGEGAGVKLWIGKPPTRRPEPTLL